MNQVQQFVKKNQLDLTKDYSKLETGDGYVDSSTENLAAAIHPKLEAQFIAVLTFQKNIPRGNHYHLNKTEYMVVLKGNLLCSFFLPDKQEQVFQLTLKVGEMVKILPGCIHTYEALEEDVIALEYSPQKYSAADVISVN